MAGTFSLVLESRRLAQIATESDDRLLVGGYWPQEVTKSPPGAEGVFS
jgi:hypothetical protein